MNKIFQNPIRSKGFVNVCLGLFLVAISFLHSGCETTATAPSVTGVGHEFDSSFNFYNAETFAIVRPDSGSPMSPILRRNILTETAAQLTTMGYREVSDPAKADLLISAHGTSRRVVDTVSYNNIYYTRTYRRSGWVYTGGYPSTYITTREEGTLLLDIADAKTKELVWRGWGVRRFTLASEVSNAQIRESVKRLLRDFPPER